MCYKGVQKEFDGRSLVVSTVAGAVGAGFATKAAQINNIAKLGKYGNSALKEGAGLSSDAIVSAGSKAFKGDDVTFKGVATDVLAGKLAGSATGKFAKGRAEASPAAAELNSVAKRAERMASPTKANGSARQIGSPGRRARQAEAASAAQKRYISDAEIRGGSVGSGSAQSTLDVIEKSNNNERN